jgi:hypothetical protein
MAIPGLSRAPEVCRPRNGDISKVFGVFKTVCCDAEIVIGVGVAFPDCPNHKNLPTAWKQISDLDPRIHQPNTAGKIKLSLAARRKPA